MKMKKVLPVLVLCMCLSLLWGNTAYATGNVANAIEETWLTAAQQIKTVVNKVVFPAVDTALVVLFFVKVGTTYMDYRKHGQIEWTPAVILFVCLVFMLTAPLYIWDIVGL